MRKTWWKVPLYCIVASWVSFQLETILGRWTLVTLPDGSLTTDFTRWRIMEAVLLAAIVCVGGFLFFRRMTRKEIFSPPLFWLFLMWRLASSPLRCSRWPPSILVG